MTDQPMNAGWTASGQSLMAQAVTLHRQGRLAEAEALYRQIVRHEPSQFDALHLCGVIALQTRRTAEGIALIRQAIALNGNVAAAHNNLGNALREQHRHDEALASFEQAIELRPDDAEAHRNRGMALHNLGRHAEAAASFEAAKTLRPDLEFLPGLALHARLTACDWRGLDDDIAMLAAAIARGEPAAMPFAAVALLDDPGLHRTAAEVYVRAKAPHYLALPDIVAPRHHERLRVGYFSADFHNHATAYLMAELFERHDRAAFEITAFSWGNDPEDAMRQRLTGAFDRFLDVRAQSDRDVALLARSLEIDIAVDLKGFTRDFRPAIFASRAAPVQVNYLGYPGTMGAGYVDYIVADAIVVPEAAQQHYREKIVWLPDSYQPNDRRRQITDRTPTRAEAGLPSTGCVFCCFNNSYKITPEVFDSWIRILRQVDRSVLWLLHDNDAATANLRAAAAQRGIDPGRLVFAERQPLADHLARHRLADLFLDTLPYNAHTTASDALWAGLPVLTRPGAAFAGRVAASLLHAVGLPEMIAPSPESYEAKAVALATNPASLAAIRQRLARNRDTAPLFDTARFTRQLEAAYRAMQARHQAGLPPDHIRISPADGWPAPAELAAMLARGAALHRQGDLKAAADLYQGILRHDPTHFDALHLSGVVALQLRNTAEGVALIRQAIAQNPNVAAAHSNLGNGLSAQDRHEEALACFDRAIALGDHTAQHKRAIILRRLAPVIRRA